MAGIHNKAATRRRSNVYLPVRGSTPSLPAFALSVPFEFRQRPTLFQSSYSQANLYASLDLFPEQVGTRATERRIKARQSKPDSQFLLSQILAQLLRNSPQISQRDLATVVIVKQSEGTSDIVHRVPSE